MIQRMRLLSNSVSPLIIVNTKSRYANTRAKVDVLFTIYVPQKGPLPFLKAYVEPTIRIGYIFFILFFKIDCITHYILQMYGHAVVYLCKRYPIDDYPYYVYYIKQQTWCQGLHRLIAR